MFNNVIVNSFNERRIPMRTLRAMADGSIPRYMNVPRNISEVSKVRSSLYTFSVAAGDVTSLIPGKFMPSVRNNSLQLARALGDFNAMSRTVQRLAGRQVGGAAGERLARRVTGRAAGSVVRLVPGDNPASRILRSKMGSQFQRAQNKLFNSGKKSLKIQGRGQIYGPKANAYMGDAYQDFLYRFGLDFATMVQKYTPIDTGKLIKSITVSAKATADNEHTIAVSMGNNSDVYYAPYVEYGRGAGYQAKVAGLPQAPAPAGGDRLRNYKGFQPARAPMRKGAIAITAKYRGLLKEKQGVNAVNIAPFLRKSVKGVFG